MALNNFKISINREFNYNSITFKMILHTPNCKVSESRNAKSRSKMVFMAEVKAVFRLES